MPQTIQQAINAAVAAHLQNFAEGDVRQAESDRLALLNWFERSLEVGLGIADLNVQDNAGGGGGDNVDVQVGAVDLNPAPVVNANEAAEAAKTVSRILSRAPKYTGLAKDTNWRTWKLAFSTWSTLAGLDRCTQDYGKSVLFSLMESSALERARVFAPGTDQWTACPDFHALLHLLSECFAPSREKGFIRIEFENRVQNSREAVYDYLAAKLALYREAYGDQPDAQLPFPALRDAVIKGLAMPSLRRAVYRLDPTSEAELHTLTLRACSDEAILWSMGASESSSLTGIGPISHLKGGVKSFGGYQRGQGKVPKPPGRGRGTGGAGAQASFPKGSCFNCGSMDHWISECPQPPSASKGSKPQVATAKNRGRGRGRGGQRGGRGNPKKKGRGGQNSVRNVDEVGQEAGEEQVTAMAESVANIVTVQSWDDQWSSSSSTD